MTRKTLTLLGCLVVLSSGSAFAEDEQEGEELVEKVAVRNRLFTVANKFELGANFGFSLLPKLTEHYIPNVSVAYNFADWLGLELRGGYAIGRLTSLAQQIQEDPGVTTTKVADAKDLRQMTWHAVLGLRFQPIYGKLSLLAELPVHFQLYAWAGGGVTGMARESIVLCPDTAQCTAWRNDPVGPSPYYRDEPAVSPLVSLALGFRFFLGNEADHSIKIEARSWHFLDRYLVDITRASVSSGNPTGGGTFSPDAGITNLVQLDLGYAFIF
ncbi:MAG: outer membrane beta-barrel domain-containing protein [Archangium sp.]